MKYDVCFVVDGTGSMGAYLHSLCESLPQAVHLMRVLNVVDRVGVLVYRDYDQPLRRVTEFSGWHQGIDHLAEFVSHLRPEGGRDYPDAAKTAAVRLLLECDKPCIVLWYTDAPPHHRHVSSSAVHLELETQALGKDFDWVSICRKFAAAQHRVFAFLPSSERSVASFYAMLASFTGGCAMHLLREGSSEETTRHTVGTLLSLAGHEYDFADSVQRIELQPVDNEMVRTEVDCDRLLPCSGYGIRPLRLAPMTVASFGVAGMQFGDSAGVASGLTQRFVADKDFQDVVYEVLFDVLRPEHVKALAYNSVLGTLWRAVCASRGDARRGTLVARLRKTISVLPQDIKEELKAVIEDICDGSNAVAGMSGASVAVSGRPVIVLDKFAGNVEQRAS
eukprot:361771-Chlamydomonas_euryale.AAC.3